MPKRIKGECQGWEAWHDHMPGGPPTLHVTGKCRFPTTGYKVTLKPAKPQGINPKIYILERVVKEPSGPAADVVTTEKADYQEHTANEYDEVHILPDNIHVKVKEAH